MISPETHPHGVEVPLPGALQALRPLTAELFDAEVDYPLGLQLSRVVALDGVILACVQQDYPFARIGPGNTMRSTLRAVWTNNTRDRLFVESHRVREAKVAEDATCGDSCVALAVGPDTFSVLYRGKRVLPIEEESEKAHALTEENMRSLLDADMPSDLLLPDSLYFDAWTNLFGLHYLGVGLRAAVQAERQRRGSKAP